MPEALEEGTGSSLTGAIADLACYNGFLIRRQLMTMARRLEAERCDKERPEERGPTRRYTASPPACGLR